MMVMTTSSSAMEKAAVPGYDGAFIPDEADVSMMRGILNLVIGSPARAA